MLRHLRKQCHVIRSSHHNAGGGEDKSFHNRTVASREAEMTAFGEGNTTARTYSMQSVTYHGYGRGAYEMHAHRRHGRPGMRRA